MRQTGVRDLSAAEDEPLDLGHPLQVRQTVVGDARVIERECGEVGQILQIRQAVVGDVRVVEEEDGEVRQVLEGLGPAFQFVRMASLTSGSRFRFPTAAGAGVKSQQEFTVYGWGAGESA